MKRSELIFLYDIKDNNPNGDPLDNNKPRIDEETNINIVTDVRLKRTIRDYLQSYKGQEIFVREIRNEKGNVQDAKARARDFGNTKEEAVENILKNCIDVRLFGATIPLEFKKNETGSATFTGPVQFAMGRSLHRVVLKRIKGTGGFASGEDKDNKTFREEYVLPYSLIGFYGIVNEHAAESTKLTENDLTLLLEAMWNGTKNLISRSKIGQNSRLLLRIEYKEDNYHIGDLIKRINLVSEKPDEEIKNITDFKLDFENLLRSVKEHREEIDKIYFKKDTDIMEQPNLIEGISQAGVSTEELNF